MKLIFTSFLDTVDFYKLTMGQMVFNQFPEAIVSYEFTNRGKTRFPQGFANQLRMQIALMSDLQMTDMEFDFLKKIRFLKPTYLEWLRHYRFNPSEVTVHENDCGEISIRVHGPWYRTIYWEVALMALIGEMYFDGTPKADDWVERIHRKADKLSKAGVNWIDFGTRRRFSGEVQDQVVNVMRTYKGFRGTSNPFLAMKYGVKVQGTVAHEAFMGMQAKYGIRMANQMTLDHWAEEFNGDLGIMLPDTLTTDVFLKTLTKRDAKLFDGSRLDSGDMIVAGEKHILKYKQLDVDPMDKILVPSDGLNDDEAIRIHRHFEGKVKGTTAGIGTFLSNDVFTLEQKAEGFKPLNMVIKMADADFGFGAIKVVKLSDVPGKYTGDPTQIEHVKRELGII